MLVDPRGGAHPVAQCVAGARAKEVGRAAGRPQCRDVAGILEVRARQREQAAKRAPPPPARKPREGDRPRTGATQGAVHTAKGVAKLAGSLFEGIASLFESALAGEEPPLQDTRGPAQRPEVQAVETTPKPAPPDEVARQQQDEEAKAQRRMESAQDGQEVPVPVGAPPWTTGERLTDRRCGGSAERRQNQPVSMTGNGVAAMAA